MLQKFNRRIVYIEKSKVILLTNRKEKLTRAKKKIMYPSKTVDLQKGI